VKLAGQWRYVYHAIDSEELLPAAWHRTDGMPTAISRPTTAASSRGLRPMRGLKQDRNARVVIAGHGFMQNLRRGHYELAVEEPVPGAWRSRSTSLPWRSDARPCRDFPCRELIRCNSALLHDRDAKFCRSFDDVFGSEGGEVLVTPIRAPKANAYAERWVRTVRTKCLDWLVILEGGHLEQVLWSTPPTTTPIVGTGARSGAAGSTADLSEVRDGRPSRVR
jgi:hypothetical protein